MGQDRDAQAEHYGRGSPDAEAVIKTEEAVQGLLYRQERCRLIYITPRAQYAVASLIFSTFLTTIAEKQVDPFSEWTEPWTSLEIVYNVLFTIGESSAQQCPHSLRRPTI